MYFRFTAI